MIMTVDDLLPSPVSYEACCFVRKYICCKKYSSTRTLVRILTMSSSNEEKPVKLLALGKHHNDITSQIYFLTSNL